MNLYNIKRLLKEHEGVKKFPYICPAGKLTIGVGRNLEDVGLRENEIEYLLDNDIKECLQDLMKIFPNFNAIDEVRQAVLIDMRFNLGAGGFRSFRRFIKAVRERDWSEAVKEMKNSKWYYDVRDRAKRLCKMMETGEWPF